MSISRDDVREIILFPYFLAAGTHVKKDIPRVVDVAKRAYPEIDFGILSYLGALDGIDTLILRLIRESGRQADPPRSAE